jgi:ubiquitin C-terminal hydrolase
MAASGGLVCRPCSKLMSKFSIRRHVKEMHLDVGIIWQCPLCKSKKNTKSALKHHVYKDHPELKGIDYDKCSVKEEY